MASSVIDILHSLGLSESSELYELLDKLEDYNLVTTEEIRNIKNISVKPLPNIVRNQADALKQRMYGVATDEDYGLPVVINRRMVLVRYILENFKYRLDDLDENLSSWIDTIVYEAENGGFISRCAQKDAKNNIIDETYETKEDANQKQQTVAQTINSTKEELKQYTNNQTNALEQRIQTKLNGKADITYVDTKVANLVNSAPETLDTLGELAAAFSENKEVVEALDEAITKKADISYVDEKLENVGVPTDLLDRVETLETLSEEAVYMEDTEFDVEEETGGSVGSGKEIVEITTPLLKIEQTPYGEHINFEFKNEWNNKYIIYDWSIDQQTFDSVQDLQYIIINSSEKILTNSTILIKVPYMGGIINNDTTYFQIYAPKGFVFVENFFNAKTYHEGCRYLDNDNFNYCRYTFETWDDSYHFIKIDFDDNGFATIYLFDSYEV